MVIFLFRAPIALGFGQNAASDALAEGAMSGLPDDAAALDDQSAWENLSLA